MNWLVAAGPVPSMGEADGWGDYTVRQIINVAGIANQNLDVARVTFKAGTSQGLKIVVAYIGVAAGSGDEYDFESTPVQLFFGNNAGCTIAANGSAVSDVARFSIPAGKNVIVSFYILNDTSYDNPAVKPPYTNWKQYYKGGDDAATVDATGYSLGLTNTVIAVSQIEVARNDSFFIFL